MNILAKFSNYKVDWNKEGSPDKEEENPIPPERIQLEKLFDINDKTKRRKTECLNPKNMKK